VRPPRRAACGSREIAAALAAGEPLAAVFVARGASSEPEVASLLARARDAGAAVHAAGPQVLRRFGRGEGPCRIVAVVGPSPGAGLDELMARAGAVWLLAGLAYATNAGFAIRTAEVAGAAGVVVDAAYGAAGRRTALRASMRADRVMPVLWQPAAAAVEAARRAGVRVVALEESGTAAPRRPHEADAVRRGQRAPRDRGRRARALRRGRPRAGGGVHPVLQRARGDRRGRRGEAAPARRVTARGRYRVVTGRSGISNLYPFGEDRTIDQKTSPGVAFPGANVTT
jgi:tRNA G18 (ribose-2'-O)-methylase SpoU